MLDQQEKARRLSRGIEVEKRRVVDSLQKEAELLAQLERLETRLKADRRNLLDLQKEIGEQEDRLADKQAEMEILLVEQEELRQEIQPRLAAYYRLGEVGILNALFSASSLPELLDLEEYFRRLVHHDRQMITSFREKIAEVNEAGRKLSEEKLNLSALQAEILEQEQRAAATRLELMNFLTTVQKEKKLKQRAIKEMEKAAQQLAHTLEKLKEEAPAPDPETPTPLEGMLAGDEQNFAARKGRLPPPVAGTLITGFGDEITGKFGIISQATGISIKTEPGAQIRAIHDGRVVYAGYLRGYGNLLIIDHGRQYYSLMAQAERFFTGKDAEVQTGQVVGVMGDFIQTPAEGLHFEIRHGSTPQDPLAWLDTSSLLLPAVQQEKIRPDFSSFKSRQAQ